MENFYSASLERFTTNLNQMSNSLNTQVIIWYNDVDYPFFSNLMSSDNASINLRLFQVCSIGFSFVVKMKTKLQSKRSDNLIWQLNPSHLFRSFITGTTRRFYKMSNIKYMPGSNLASKTVELTESCMQCHIFTCHYLTLFFLWTLSKEVSFCSLWWVCKEKSQEGIGMLFKGNTLVTYFLVFELQNNRF